MRLRTITIVMASGLGLAFLTHNATSGPSQGHTPPREAAAGASESKPSADDETAARTSPADVTEPRAETAPRQVFSGEVVLLRDELKERGIATAQEHTGDVVLRTSDGVLLPILADWRGRAFYQDERLRRRAVTLVGYLRPQIPYLQVLMVYTRDEAGRLQYTDYWCDICAIPMYEIKPCDCCQGEIRLRFQPQELPAELQQLPANGGLTGGFAFPGVGPEAADNR